MSRPLFRSKSTRRSTRQRTKAWYTSALVLFALACLGTTGLVIAQDRVVTTPASIEQDLLPGFYTVNEVLQSGRQFFAAPYLPEDGHGEGDGGPRADQRRALWEMATTGDGLELPFLRVNGLDSQDCFACHNTAGSYVPPGEIRRTEKPGGVGGSADFASVLFANEFFPELSGVSLQEEERQTLDQERLTHVVRAPPKAFGTAYAQELALEMTDELQQIEADATTLAAASPGTPITRNLTAKGVDFGSITITCPTSSCNSPDRNTANVDGVSPTDLIVRPFQHKGIAATIRSFTKTALDFHFSMQPVEVVGINTDCDADGLRNEMAVDVTSFAANASSLQVQQSLGNTLALTAFTGMLRPPVTDNQFLSREVANGKQIFSQIGCADCHVPTLDTRPYPQFRIELSEPADGCPTSGGTYGGSSTPRLGSFAEADATKHPAIKAVDNQRQAEAARGTSAAVICPNDFYCIDLTSPGVDPNNLPGDFLPRLPQNKDGTVTVPLYSDLKRHDLGPYLAQVLPNQADDAGTAIPAREWLTTKLWGVADNGPWLHDGRARTLREAILMHDGETGNDNQGEAVSAVNGFQGLSAADRDDLIAFLESLSVPPA